MVGTPFWFLRSKNDPCLARSCSSRITQGRPAVTCGGRGPAVLRRTISENYTRLRKRGDDADAPLSRSFSDCRSRTRRLAPKCREDVLWALSCFLDWLPNAASAQSLMRRRREHVLAEVSSVALGSLRRSHRVLTSPEPGAVMVLLLSSGANISIPLDQHSP